MSKQFAIGRKTFAASVKKSVKNTAKNAKAYKHTIRVEHVEKETAIEFNLFTDTKTAPNVATIRKAFFIKLSKLVDEGDKGQQKVADFLGYKSAKGFNHVPTWLAWASDSSVDHSVKNKSKAKTKASASKPKQASKLADKAPAPKGSKSAPKAKQPAKPKQAPKAKEVKATPPSASAKGDDDVLSRLLALAEQQQATINAIVELAK